jgi:hypothetical protein
MKMEMDSGDGLMDGLWITSSDTLAGISSLVEPIFNSRPASLLFALGT